MRDVFYGGIEPLVRIAVVGTLSYLALLIIIRVAGQRPLGRMQTFDVVVAVALGSTFGRLLTAQEVEFDEAVFAIGLLAGLHFVSAWLTFRSRRLACWIETRPQLLFYQGELQEDTMQRHRLTRQEVLAAIRKHGITSMSEVFAVVLESDGTFSVLRHPTSGAGSTLEGVEGGPP